MKSILLTITPQQLQTSINELKTEVNNLDTVKEVQDKLISYQDHQISFLNDSIANIWQTVGIAATLIVLVISGAFAIVSLLSQKANKRLTEATDAFNKAKQDAEELDRQIKEAASVVEEAKNIASTAEDKLKELEKEQKDIMKMANVLETNQRLDMGFNQNKRLLKITGDHMDQKILKSTTGKITLSPERKSSLNSLMSEHKELSEKDKSLELSFTLAVSSKLPLSKEKTKDIDELNDKVLDFFDRAYDFLQKPDSE